jgi:hypothetical protein
VESPTASPGASIRENCDSEEEEEEEEEEIFGGMTVPPGPFNALQDELDALTHRVST